MMDLNVISGNCIARIYIMVRKKIFETDKIIKKIVDSYSFNKVNLRAILTISMVTELR